MPRYPKTRATPQRKYRPTYGMSLRRKPSRKAMTRPTISPAAPNASSRSVRCARPCSIQAMARTKRRQSQGAINQPTSPPRVPMATRVANCGNQGARTANRKAATAPSRPPAKRISMIMTTTIIPRVLCAPSRATAGARIIRGSLTVAQTGAYNLLAHPAGDRRQWQPCTADVGLGDVRGFLSTHLYGELCERCREALEDEIGTTLFYLAAFCYITGLDLDAILRKERDRVSALGVFHLAWGGNPAKQFP